MREYDFYQEFLAWCGRHGIRPYRVRLTKDQWSRLCEWWFIPPGLFLNSLRVIFPWGTVVFEAPCHEP